LNPSSAPSSRELKSSFVPLQQKSFEKLESILQAVHDLLQSSEVVKLTGLSEDE